MWFADQQDSVKKYTALVKEFAPNSKALYGLVVWQAIQNGEINTVKEFARKYFEDDTLNYNKEVGVGYLFLKNWKEAEKYYARSTYRDMDWGLVLLKLGKKDSGLSVLRKVAALREINRDWNNATRVYAALGDKIKAISCFRKTNTYALPSNDPFWDGMREEPEFKELLIESVKKQAEIMKQIKGDERKKFSLDF